jgi:hypothetical protein
MACAAGSEVPRQLRYERQAGEKDVLECEVKETRGKDGSTYVARTHRPGETMTLRLSFDARGRVISARAVQQIEKRQKTAVVTFQESAARVRRSGQKDVSLAGVTGAAVVTTAPDWSDIFLLARRYDRKKGGRQAFPGLWIHPVQPPRVLTFTIENLGRDAVTYKGKKQVLDRYRIRLRSSDYLAWADGQGVVYKLMVPGKPASAVVLKGYREATRGLGRLRG